ncbi:hypothetical protein [Litoribrevibacter albus]|uniref:DUF4149 domain-containing protein n=1 Tax=Litoribrevibacter albus TaxID=1473156 RepID=A0AA37S802_9GAMM|nr:hypothetical protein [Litoribrevibacter albus]GLQ29688.1 hypothetical protein GCM10007876_01660 [Litoribrevibacter albus]
MTAGTQVKPQIGAGTRLILTFWLGSLWAVGYLAIPFIAKSMPDPSQWQPLALGLKYLAINVGIFCGAVVLIGRLFELHLNKQSLIETQSILISIMLVLSGVYSFRQYGAESIVPEQDLLFGMVSLLGIILLANRKD